MDFEYEQHERCQIELNSLVNVVETTISSTLVGKEINLLSDDDLKQALSPVRAALGNIDTHALLGKPCCGPSSRICQPIHNEIQPVAPGVRYIHLKEAYGIYSVGIFVFPPNAEIPLHDHPGMTVLSRVLYGTLGVKSYDVICEEEQPVKSSRRTSKKKGKKKSGWQKLLLSVLLNPRRHKKEKVPSSTANMSSFVSQEQMKQEQQLQEQMGLHVYENEVKYLSAPDVTELYPRKGNLHHFKAGPEGAAVLDVLVPPYDTGDDRDCTYYVQADHLSKWCPKEKKIDSWLIASEQPRDFSCTGGIYNNLGAGDAYDPMDDDTISSFD